jgi:hypothetical protein
MATGWAEVRECKMSAISSVIPDTEPSTAAADTPVSNLLSFAAAVGVDDAFANLGVPYGATDTPASAYTTFLSGVGVDDVFANVGGVGAVAGIGDPIATLGNTGDEVVAGSGLDGVGVLGDQGLAAIAATANVIPAGGLGLGDALGGTGLPGLGGSGLLGNGPLLETSADASGPVSNLLSFASSVGVDDAFANLGVPYGATDTPANAYITYLAGVGVDDAFANAASVGAVAGVGDPVAAVGNLGDDVVAALGPTLGGGVGATQFEFPALGGTGDKLPLATAADATTLAAIAEPLGGTGEHTVPDTPLHGHLI